MITNKCKETDMLKQILKQMSFLYQRHLKTIAVVHWEDNLSHTLVTKELDKFTNR